MLSKEGIVYNFEGGKNTGLHKQTASCFARSYQMIPNLWLIKEPQAVPLSITVCDNGGQCSSSSLEGVKRGEGKVDSGRAQAISV